MAQNLIADQAAEKAALLSDAEFNAEIEALAQEIERLEREAIFRIAARLADAHARFLYRRDEGGFTGWVENRLGYSLAHAYRLLDVAKLVQSFSAWETFGTLPITAVYAIAAPSTPEEVRGEILDRVKAGERLTCAAVTEAIADAKWKLDPTKIGKSEAVDTENAPPDVAADRHDADAAGDPAQPGATPAAKTNAKGPNGNRPCHPKSQPAADFIDRVIEQVGNALNCIGDDLKERGATAADCDRLIVELGRLFDAARRELAELTLDVRGMPFLNRTGGSSYGPVA